MDAMSIIPVIWVLALAAAAVSDLRSFRIPNYLPAVVIGLFVISVGIAGFSEPLWQNLLHFLLALLVGMGLFGLGWIGGGDAKLYAAVALWFGWAGGATLVLATTLSGLVLAIIFVGARMMGFRKGVPKEDRRIPYGVAIAAGAILSAAWSGFGEIFPGV